MRPDAALTLTFTSKPTMRLVAEELLKALTGSAHSARPCDPSPRRHPRRPQQRPEAAAPRLPATAEEWRTQLAELTRALEPADSSPTSTGNSAGCTGRC
ncbi:hypothetical protein AB0C27_44485 [Nonomuraea sp. NPDC048882]|uniref:hypothetical protein n=1 Tax=Nonomuraea sp. NPDC048882 TaxID=3154347 RepID=UPI00340DD73A